MNFKRAARKSLSGLLTAMMVITQLSNNFTYAEVAPEDPTPVVETAPEPEVPAEPTTDVTEEIPPTEETPAETPVEEVPVEETTEPQEEEVTDEEEKKEEEENYKTEFISYGWNATVTATAPKSAKFSETTEMVVEYYSPGTGEYEAYLSAAKNNLGINDETSFLYGDIYNIYFVDQGEVVTPKSGKVHVTVEFYTPVALGIPEDQMVTGNYVYHFNGDGSISSVKESVSQLEDGSISAVTFNSGSFSPFGVFTKTVTEITVEEETEEEKQNAIATRDLRDYISAASINAQVNPETGAYIIEEGKAYAVSLNFKESFALQFPENGSMTYALPAGFDKAFTDSGSVSINISDPATGNAYTINGNTYSINNGEITFNWNTADPNFIHLTESTNVRFKLTFNGKFDGTETHLDFGNGITKDIEFKEPEPGQAYVNKSGNFNSETGKFEFTIKVNATGDVTNVKVTDTISGNALIFNNDVQISGNSSNPSGGATGNGFDYTFPSMREGEEITITYTCNPDYSKAVDGKFTWDQTKNEVIVKPDGGEPHNSEYANEINLKSTQKSGGTISGTDADGNKIVDWSITYNPLALAPAGGDKIIDKIGAASTDYMKYYGDGITVTRYNKDGSEAGSETVSYSSMGGTDSTWTWNIPSGDTTPYKYVITYQTIVDMEKVNQGGAAVDLTNDANGSDGGINIGPANEIEITKDVVSSSTEEVTWVSTIDVPEAGLSQAVVTDSVPGFYGNGHMMYDLYKDGSLEVTGLLEGESYDVSVSDSKVVITFYKDAGKTQTGLQGTSGGHRLTVRLTTLVDQEWLQYGYEHPGGYEATHTNTIDINGKKDTANVTFVEPGIEKSGVKNTSWDGTTTYFYTLTLKNVQEEPLEITDTFDTDLLEVATSGTDWQHMIICGGNQYSQGEGRYPVTYSESADGVILTANSLPKQANGEFYPYYKITYYLQLKDGVDLQELAILNGGTHELTNTAMWGERESSFTFETKYNFMEKKLVNEGQIGGDKRRCNYTITYNPAGAELNGGEDVVLTDNFSNNLNILYDTITFSDPDAVVTYNVSGHTATYTIKDGKALTISYDAIVIGTGSQNLINEASVEGHTSKVDVTKEFGSGGEGAGELLSIKILKHETGKMDKRIQGAKFQLFEKDGDVPVQGRGGNYIFTTGADGTWQIDSSQLSLYEDKTYYVKEIEAPPGYELSPIKWEFTLTTDPTKVDTWHYIYPTGYTMRITDDVKTAELKLKKTFEGDIAAEDLTDEQKAQIVFTVTKPDDPATEEDDSFEQSYTYDQFTDGEYIIKGITEGTYLVRESAPDIDGYELTTTYQVDAVESESGNVTYTAADIESANTHEVNVVNTYTIQETTAEIKAEKGFEWGDRTDEFTFILTAGTNDAGVDTPMPADTTSPLEKTVSKDNPTAVFGEISYSKAGTYNYTITEKVPEDAADGKKDGIAYDTTTHNVVVTVEKGSDNKLSATVTYDGEASLTIENTYEAEGEGEIKVQKVLEGREWTDDDTFTFTLSAAEGTPMPAATSIDIKKADADQTKSFGTIKFTEAGTYTYTVQETKGTADGVTYDTAAHTVTITVVDDGKGNLVAEDGDTTIKTETITNTFEGTEATLEATKQINDWGAADSFTFNIVAVGDAPAPEKSSAEATETEKTASFGTVKFDKAGTYEYIITEVDGGVDGVTYDTTPHTAVVTVTKDPDTNKLTATVKYDGEDALVIINSYESSKATIQATKGFEDWGKAETFTFNLAAVDNAPMPEKSTVTVTEENKTGVFGEVEYKTAGTYEYTITEVNDHVPGVTYDETAHKVVVEVTKGSDNKLTATVKYDGAESLIITNTFEGTEATIEATKEFNDWGKAESFTFNIEAVTPDAPMPASLSATATEAEKTASFGTVKFDKVGEYKYTITEVNDGVDGVTYDARGHEVVVTVSADPNTNELSAEVKYDGAESLTISNIYEGTEAELEATKQINDWGAADSFTFNIVPVGDAPAPEKSSAVATEAQPTASFGTVKFEKAGTYEYTITEVDDGVDGVTYDTTEHKAVVTVTKEEGTNKLTASVKYDGADALVITNTYATSKATIQATKAFEDWGKADSFTFNLEAVTEGAPMPANTSVTVTEDNKTGVFGEVEYKTAGTYEYTITEVNDGVDGVTYDTTPHKVVVTVTKDSDNKLIAEVKYDDADSLVITNTYAGTEATIEATKDFADWGKAESFTFNLTAVTEDAPMPASRTAVATEAQPLASFGTIKYEKAGTYKYYITEVNDGVDGVTYDSARHEVIVTVTKAEDATNALSAEVTYDEAESLTITNTYEGTEATLEATKQINDWGAADSFTFNITPVGEAPAPEKTSVEATEAQPTASFGTVKFEKAGTYEYIINEVDDGVDGVTYDTSDHKAVVTVTKEEGTNKLTATVKYDDQDSLVITNSYASSKATIQATKAFNDWGKAESFTFNLEAVDDAPMPANTTVTVTEDAPTGVFGEIEYKSAGTYEYTITEVDDGVEGVTYDTTPHKVVVTVTKGEGNKLVAEVKYDGEDALIITNSYNETTAELHATKGFDDWGKADSFTFDLAPVDNAPMPEVTEATATEGTPRVTFGPITYKSEGTYEYTITERDGKAAGVTYDTTPHTATVVVTRDPDTNELSAEVTYDDDKSVLIIVNTFEGTTAHFEATKEFSDWGKADSFTFDLAAVTEGAPMPASTTATATEAEKTAVFGDMEFEAEGVYEYTITEQQGDADGVTYDTTAHKAIVTVTKNEDTNALEAVVSYEDGDTLTITNTYAATKATIEATKDFNDWGKADSFTFNLAAVTEGAPMPASTTATATEAAPKAVFGDIEFEKAGEYKYTITEVNDHVDGVTYDETPHEVIVTVTADPDTNVLSAVVTYDGAESLTITNTYTSVEDELHVTKAFEDWGKADSFTFDLAAVGDAPMPTVTEGVATEDAKMVTFGPITFEKAGTYEYTITERDGGADGVTYDTTPHKATVEVTADPDTNELSTKVTYDDGADVLIIVNTYETTKTHFEAEKEFEDWGKADSFTFEVAAVTEGAPMPASTTAIATEADPIAVFGDIEFEKSGTYEYTITEINDHADGVTYDTTAHAVVVEVTKGEGNKLEANVTYDGAESLIITNTYATTKTTIEATKEFNDWGKADSFTFNLEAVTPDAPMPASTSAVATEANPLASFGEVEYEKSGTYIYTITEVNDGVDGVTYDTTAHQVVVEVTADPDTNELSASVTYDEQDSLTITNSYEGTETTLEATKQINDWGAADSFTFNIVPVGDAPAPEQLSAVATEAQPTASFGTVKFEKAGTYEYTITEVDDGVDGVTYDTSEHKAVVTVTKEEGTNKLSASVKYDDKDSLIITNKYASSKAIIQATKAFNDWGKAEAFEFHLAPVTENAPMPAKDSVTVTKDAPTGVFGEIEYKTAGTYEYTITETNDHAPGVTYDETPHAVVVEVTKGEGNKLVADVTYDGEDSLIITNTYESTKTTLEATKEFNDWGKANNFTFKLAAVTEGAPMPASDTAVATEAEPKAVFGEIEYEKGGEYQYTITEIDDGIDGVTYDTTPHLVIVMVDQDPVTNKLSAYAIYEESDGLTITNTYAGVDTTLEATKQINDWGAADSFTFNITPVGEAPAPEKTSAEATEDAPTASFGKVHFEKAGTYEYIINEVDGGVDGVTYDTSDHKAVVTVTKGEDNKLSASVKYDDGDALVITNTYASSNATIQATKSFSDWGKADSFTFNLEAVTENAPMPANTSVTVTEDAPTGVFGQIEYKKAGTYEYTITEVNDHVDGVAYDTAPHAVVVEVTKGEGNKLVANVTYDGAESLVITNTYASTSATIEATKEFNDWGKADSFTFNLAAVTPEAPMPASTSAIATEAEPKAVFGEITFEKSGTYTYTITEVNDGVDGVTYDTTAHQVVVEVTADAETNALSAKVTYDGAESLIITNTYEGTETTLEVTKQFNDWGAADSFTFNIAPVGDAPAPENTRAQATEDAPTASFGTVKFEKAGTYEYTITEVDDGVDGVTYDTSEHKAVVTVAKEEGTNKLSATVKYDDQDALVITNTYESSSATIQATKAFEDWGKADNFTFKLAAVGDAPMPANDSVTVTQDAPTGVFGQIEYKKAGTYEYTITEVNDHVDGVTYDTAEHKVVVEVTKSEDNKLTANVTYDGADSLVITNTYASTKAPIEVTKEFNDWAKAESFTFNLEAVDGAPMPASTTATATKDAPKASFGEITFEKSGTYKYTITEVNDHVAGVTYDTTAHEVVVEVTADPDTNELSAKVTYDGSDSLVVTNTFTATTAQVEATKEINYWGKNGEFTFTFDLAALTEGAPMPETTSQTVKKDSPTAVFGDMTFDKVGTYQYSITEKDEGLKGVTYDMAPHTATVEVTADPETNALSAKVTYADGEKAVITNKYEAKGEYKFGGIKTLEGRELKDAEFSFTLTGDKSVDETVTNTGESFTFTPIEFTLEDLEQNADGSYKDGTFKFTIKEVAGDAKGVNYDDTVYEITLTVSDKGDGTLEVTADKEIEAIKFVNVYQVQPGNGEFVAKKVLSGNQKLKDQQFTFELKDKDGKVLQSKKNDASGNVLFDKIEYTEAGEYVYTVSEVNDGQKDIVYDNSVYTITVKAEDDGEGNLKVTSVITKGGQVVNAIAFRNTTTPNTGIHNGSVFLTGAAAASLSGIAILEYLRRKQKNSKK